MTIDLLQLEGEPFPFARDVVVPPDRVDPDLVAAPVQVRLRGRVVPVADEFSVVGSCEIEAQLLCSRCLAPVAWSSVEDFTLQYRVAAPPSDEDDIELAASDLDVVHVPDGQLDLAELAAEQTVLALPMRTVCRADCAGLCPRCGANRNRPGDCQCEPDVDPRWAPLANLRSDQS